MSVSIFISHSWKYPQHYDKLAEWIFGPSQSEGGAPLSFKNYSVPREYPIQDVLDENSLQQAVFDRIAKSDVVIIPTGMYATHSKWIQKEIAGAKHHKKPILAVTPEGQERKSSVVVDAADKFVAWDRKAIVDGIRDLCGARP